MPAASHNQTGPLLVRLIIDATQKRLRARMNSAYSDAAENIIKVRLEQRLGCDVNFLTAP